MSNLFQSASVITITNEMYSSFETAGRRLQGPLKERTVLTLSATSAEAGLSEEQAECTVSAVHSAGCSSVDRSIHYTMN